MTDVVDVSGIDIISNLLDDLLTLLPLRVCGLESMDYVLTDTSINNISDFYIRPFNNGTIDASGVTLITDHILL